MFTFAGLGRTLAATLIVSAFALAPAVRAQEVSDEQIKAARAALAALGETKGFDNILPNLSERLKASLIQATPNYQDLITTTVDEKAISLATRRADLEREAAVIYAKTFTVEELKAIADFYNLPVGKKLLNDRPIAVRELLKAADIWAAGVSRDLAIESDKALNAAIGKEAATTPAVETPATGETPQ
ncbi:DUF2059 domain-containing protein [Pararhizobium sp.]|uniref:DUF2059 domain-containing protein n=1 Tax=Pararhizobium sp. TaxID=1977563 RepID=UPI002719F8E8|nr:DUF2059 domain-containing protein [Pararhizobium sp.]MDO9418951.1 DUF2059 domain-containing protein [Pararhizobium sp.]